MMPVFHVVKSATRWDGKGSQPIPEIVTEALPHDAAAAAAGRLNEAEGRGTDGPVPFRYSLVQTLRPA